MNGWFSVLVSLIIGCVAGLVWCLWALRRVLAGTSLKSHTALLVEVSDLRSAFDALKDSHQRLNSRIGMRELRARRKGEPAPPEEMPEAANDAPPVESSSRESKLAHIRAQARKQGLM
jgi:hypothetical protein